ncbi:hypothetical protein FRAHR75_1000005 [Frankia sp. Hr75.2]|nr:hypothetical protein FRAHR75_1000005 [Frankia sp. Hr75.2]
MSGLHAQRNWRIATHASDMAGVANPQTPSGRLLAG